MEVPVRIELWGDEIDSIRSFDPESQRSLENLEEIYPDTLENRFYKNADKKIPMQEAQRRADAYRENYMKKENPHRRAMLNMLNDTKKKESVSGAKLVFCGQNCKISL